MSDHNPEYLRADAYSDEELVPFDPRDDTGRRAMWMLLGLVLVLAVIAVIAFNLYSSGTRDRGTTPLITSEKTPYKVAAEDEVSAQTDSSAYEAMNGETGDGDVKSVPLPENPIDLPDSATIVVDGNTETNLDNKKTSEFKPTIPPVTTPKPVTKPKPAPVTAGSSDYVVQVASVRSQADAQSLWSNVETKFRSTLPSGTYSDIKRVDLGSKGVYYRLRVAGLADKSAANRLCERLKARNQACFVTKK